MSTSDAFLAHIVSRVQADINFLVEQGTISKTDGQLISNKLPSSPTPRTPPSPIPTPPTPAPVASPMRVGPPVPPYSQMPQAKALWSYNENGQEAGDLSFSAEETIEILEETNADWWKGKNSRGETGLFPSNYVQKIASLPPTPLAFPSNHMVPSIASEKISYGPTPAASPDSQVQAAQPSKKKFGKFGSTMAQAAAGGVGFGAGAAVGGGIVNAIF